MRDKLVWLTFSQPFSSLEILRQIQRMEPPGRFLTKNYSTYEWDVVSQEKAREKVCQSLRDAVAVEREQVK